MVGRPSSYSDETADAICDRLMEGKSLLAACRDNPELPSQATVFVWLAKYPEFQEKYARAREIQAHVTADLGLEEATTAKDAALGRLAWDARRWHASKLAPKVYGDKQTTEHTGPGGGPVQSVTVVTTDPVEAAKVYAKLMGGGE